MKKLYIVKWKIGGETKTPEENSNPLTEMLRKDPNDKSTVVAATSFADAIRAFESTRAAEPYIIENVGALEFEYIDADACVPA